MTGFDPPQNLWLLLPLSLAMLSPADEAALLDRIRRRDPQAAADLYSRFGRLVFSVTLRISQNRETAEDLTQEVFLRVWNRAAQYDRKRGELGSWILTIARHIAIDHVRSAASRAQRSETPFPDAREHVQLSALTTDPELLERARRVRQALHRLDEKQRQVIQLAYFEGLSQSEMADRLGQPLGTVKTWTRAALKLLREELAEVAA